MRSRVVLLGLVLAASACTAAQPEAESSRGNDARRRAASAQATTEARAADDVATSLSSSTAAAPLGSAWRVLAHGDGYALDLGERPANVLPLFEEDHFDCRSMPPAQACLSRDVAGVALTAGSDTNRLIAIRFVHSYEHDGMHGTEEDIVLAVPSSHGTNLEVVTTLAQWETDVVDCGTTIKMRRFARASLDGDPVLCVESVIEEGVGLFDVMDLQAAKKPWKPLARKREIAAFRWDGSKHSLTSVSPSQCPKRGYGFFVPLADNEESLIDRATVQGESSTVPCPATVFGGCTVPMCAGKSTPKP